MPVEHFLGTLCLRSEDPTAQPWVAAGDVESAGQQLGGLLLDGAAQAGLRQLAARLLDGADLTRLDAPAVAGCLAVAAACGDLGLASNSTPLRLYALGGKPGDKPVPPQRPGRKPKKPKPVPPPPPEVIKAIKGRFTEIQAKCGDVAHLEADGTNLADPNSTTFAIQRVSNKAAAGQANGQMLGQSLRAAKWSPKRPDKYVSGETFTFKVSGDGQHNQSENSFKFFEYPDAGTDTKTFACASGRFAWTGKFDIHFSADVVTVEIKIKLINRLGTKPDTPGAAQPAIGEPVSDEDKAAMKADVQAKLSSKVKLRRSVCGFAAACTCIKPVKIVVSFVESGEHHTVNLYEGAGRASASNWTRTKTRANSWAHETGHLLGWYDEYTGGAVGSSPRWLPNATTHVMNTGLVVPPEYGWDFRDWFDTASGEKWTAKN